MQTFGGVEGVGKAARREKAVGFCGDGVTNFVQCLAGVRARASGKGHPGLERPKLS